MHFNYKILFIFVVLSGISITTSAQEKIIEPIGDVLQVVIPAAALTSEVVRWDKEGIKQFAYSFTTTVVITAVLKRSIDKKRPEGNGGRAFPSGHTSGAAQGASFIWVRHGWKWGLPASIAAAYVGYSRIEGETDRHDIWDVLGGATLGSLSSLIFARPIAEKEVVLTADFNRERKVIGVVVKF